MDAQSIITYKSAFDSIMHDITADDGSQMEVWHARELQQVCGYARWENFQVAINRAIDACNSQNINIDDHFRDVTKTIPMPKGAQKEIKDILLTRYAGSLIAQNGDPKKEEIAFAQSYFAVQTRRAELIAERLKLQQRIEKREELRASEKRLSQNIYERGVDDKGFARIRSKGDAALFGGYNTEQMKKRLGVKSGALADHLPQVTIAAKNLATEMTNFNVEAKDLQGEPSITTEHVQNNRTVRAMLTERGIKPELLPPAEDIKKVERRVAKEEKLLGAGQTLPRK